MPEVTFVIKDGKVEIEGEGFTGGQCHKVIDEYLQKLGQVEKREGKCEPMVAIQKQQLKMNI